MDPGAKPGYRGQHVPIPCATAAFKLNIEAILVQIIVGSACGIRRQNYVNDVF